MADEEEEVEQVEEKPERKRKVILSVTDRKDFREVVKNKVTAVKHALNGNLFPNAEDITMEALKEAGINEESDSISEKITSINYEIDEIVSEHMQNKKDERDLEKTTLKEDINKQIRLLEETYIVSKNALKDQLSAADRTINEKYKNMEAGIIAENAKEQNEKRLALVTLRTKAQEIEEKVRQDINEKNRFISKFKYRIESSLDDIYNRVLEDLVIASTRDQAVEALQKIPSAQELIQSCQSQEGLTNFMTKLNPGLSLPAPKVEQKVEATKDIEIKAEDVVIEADPVEATN